ncbi:MAG: hypothetical protein PXX77_03020 [Gallionella sp.]|nr:hypothetical protein [Gallionella sp.]
MNQEIDVSDRLRVPDGVCEPDPRTRNLVRRDERAGDYFSRNLADQHSAVDRFRLNESVPSRVAIHFETAKNLYLYAWFVFRFYPVSEQQALASLEFALRERFPGFVEEHSGKRGFGLKKLLNHAIENGYVRNEMFSTRERWAWNRAEGRYMYELSLKMHALGLGKMEWNESEITVTQEDLDCDWLGIFKENIPKIRNQYAHGSGELSHTVLHSFELVSEIINQLYPKAE